MEELESIIKHQDIMIKELQGKVELLQDMVARIIVCKQSNEIYPYYDFILSYGINPEQQCKIFDLLGLVAERFQGNILPARYMQRAGLSINYLLSDKPVSFSDVKKTIGEIISIDDEDGEIALLLIKSLRDQGIQTELCEYLLSQTAEYID